MILNVKLPVDKATFHMRTKDKLTVEVEDNFAHSSLARKLTIIVRKKTQIHPTGRFTARDTLNGEAFRVIALPVKGSLSLRAHTAYFGPRIITMEICRLCMEASNLNQSMADETIQVMVEDCIQIKLDPPNDLLPLDICDDCYYRVKDFSEFKENCHTIQEMLQQEIEENRREQDKSSDSGAQSILSDDIQYSDYIEDSLIFSEISTDVLSDLQSSCDTDIDKLANEIFNEANYGIINDSNNNHNDEIGNNNNRSDNSNNSEIINNEITNQSLFIVVNGYIDNSCNITKEQENDKTEAETGPTVSNDSKRRMARRCYRDEYSSALLTCEICGKMVHKTLLPGHLNMHNGVKPYVCPREGCKSAFHCKHKLKRHLGYKHTDGNFPCNECDKVFNSNLALYHHQFATHQLRDKACKHCDKKFRNNHGLNRHMQIHKQERKFKCSHCPMTFAKSSLCEAHSRTHTTERPYVCSKCNADYSYRRLLVNHIRRKHPGSEAMLQAIECITKVS
ncbi:zinc finger protein 23-like [Armigeres subalbatus]|uniref:zinc finger protein 23-like n=1 Tax=Armigeres subalbatus TaxID=124917 RepID=UPI002ED41F7C